MKKQRAKTRHTIFEKENRNLPYQIPGFTKKLIKVSQYRDKPNDQWYRDKPIDQWNRESRNRPTQPWIFRISHAGHFRSVEK